jgi:multiple antibiotic resistance protein
LAIGKIILNLLGITVSDFMIAGLTFWLYVPIMRLLGKSGARTVSKLAALLLAAIAVMMVRKGVMLLLADGFKIVQ